MYYYISETEKIPFPSLKVAQGYVMSTLNAYVNASHIQKEICGLPFPLSISSVLTIVFKPSDRLE